MQNMSNNIILICRICRIRTPPFPYRHTLYRMDIPFIVCIIWQNMAKNMQNMNTPQKNMPKNKKIQKFQKYVISNPGLPQYHPGFENNLFCNMYAKYAKYAKYVYLKYTYICKICSICKICKICHSGLQHRRRWNAVSCSVAVDMLWRFTAYRLDRVFSGSA